VSKYISADDQVVRGKWRSIQVELRYKMLWSKERLIKGKVQVALRHNELMGMLK